jgi:abhydrolase domain-containing protein 12
MYVALRIVVFQVKIHPMSFLWRKMPLFDFFFTGTLNNNDVGFVSDQKIGAIHIPILIMHAKVGFVVLGLLRYFHPKN